MKNKILRIPHNCYLILTSNCNMRCLHCYGNYGNDIPKGELSGEEWIKIIEDLSSQGVFFVNISGGEPTMHKDFVKIIKALSKNGIYFMLTTNGVFSEKTRKAIIEQKDYILGIQVSLDGADWKTNGFLRRDTNGKPQKLFYDLALKSIIEFSKCGIRTSVATCINKKNVNKIDDLKKLIIKIKPNNWSISTISISGRAKKNLDLYASESELPKEYWYNLKKECLDNEIYVNFVDMPSLLKTNKESKIFYECPAASWFCEIYSNGITTPCPLARTNPPKKEIMWDNIKEKKLVDIWNGEAFNTFRYYKKAGCSGCLVKDSCDRCPPQSVQWFNDPIIPPPYCIENAEKLHLKNIEKLKEMLHKAKLKNDREEYGIRSNN